MTFMADIFARVC